MAFDIFITTKYFIVYSLLHVLFDSWISLLSKLVIIENWVKNHRILKQEIFEFCMLFRFSYYEFLHTYCLCEQKRRTFKKMSLTISSSVLSINLTDRKIFMRLKIIQAF